VTVTVVAQNAGETPAKRVELADATPPEVTVVDGHLSASEASVQPGGKVALEYALRTTKQGQVDLPQPAVEYQTEDGRRQRGAGVGARVSVRSRADEFADKALATGKWVSLGYMRTWRDWAKTGGVTGTIGAAVGVNWLLVKAKRVWRERRRRRAEKDLAVPSRPRTRRSPSSGS